VVKLLNPILTIGENNENYQLSSKASKSAIY